MSVTNRVLISFMEEMEIPKEISEKISSLQQNIEAFIQKVMSELGFTNQEVSVFFCDNPYIKELNKTYRNIDNATDVLSFENGDEYEDEEGKWRCVGDIVISFETLLENSIYFDENKDNEFKRLLVHGLLHLNGMDHGEEHIEKGVEPECEMLKIQENILQKLKDEKIIL